MIRDYDARQSLINTGTLKHLLAMLVAEVNAYTFWVKLIVTGAVVVIVILTPLGALIYSCITLWTEILLLLPLD
jgi:hypothetical protein